MNRIRNIYVIFELIFSFLASIVFQNSSKATKRLDHLRWFNFLCKLYFIWQQLYQLKMYLQPIKDEDVLVHESQKRIPQSSYPRIIRDQAGRALIHNKSGHWSQKEQAKYYAFLEKFKDKFTEKESRRQWKVFKSMSQFIKTRDPNQCRSHHHKMNKNFESIEATLEYLRKKNPNLLIRSQKYAEQLIKIDQIIKEDGGFGDNFNKGENEFGFRNDQNKQSYKMESFFDKTKMNDIGNLRTDTGGLNVAEQPVMDFSGAAFAPPAATYKGFPTTGLINTSLSTVNPFPTSSYIGNNQFSYEPYMVGYQSFDNVTVPLDTKQKWLQCHECFIKWMTKLQSLIQ